MRVRLFTVMACVLWPCAAAANNGLSLIGFGTESVAMGGADTAVARDTSALNTNPAGLGQLTRPAFDGYAAAAYMIDTGHVDALGNDRRADNRVIPVMGFGFSRPYSEGRLVAGFGLFVQGGLGAVYKDLRTPFGTTDELSARVGFVRLSPGLAWQAGDQWHVGVALPVNVVLAKQRFFPRTSALDAADPARSFFGVSLDDLRGTRLGLRLGALWRPDAQWRVGATWSPKARLDAKHGHADVNLSALGAGIAHYRDARLDGLALPREIALGVAWQATRNTLVSVKVAHLAWSHALRTLTVTLSGPESAVAPSTVTQTSRIDWRDQTVFAIGVARDMSEAATAYLGFNYARNPAPPQTLTPLLALVSDRHFTAGLAYRRAGGWSAGGALEYQPRRRVAYSNMTFPIGVGAEERVNYVAATLTLSRRW